ncbi:MAG: glycosyltransferase family 2 protein [candidate division WOR-3 bacterium]
MGFGDSPYRAARPESAPAVQEPDSESQPPGDARPGPAVSIIVPAYNEVASIEPLLAEVAAKCGPDYEVVLVDDGSTDGTYEAAIAAVERYPFLTVLRHPRNLGKTAAILTGFAACRGEIISIMDADLQFDPEDVVRQVAKVREGFDIVTGQKRGRYEKRFVSSVYNWLARLVFGLKVRDINALKTFRREVLEEIHLRRDWHRYIVPLAASRGFAVAEIPVLLRPRHFGVPKYSGAGRILIGLFDLVAVGFQLTFMRKPMLYFGVLGTGALFSGLVVGIVAVILRLCGHGFRPLLYLVLLLVLTGLVLFAAGFLGESLATISDRLERIEQARRTANDRTRIHGPRPQDSGSHPKPATGTGPGTDTSSWDKASNDAQCTR